MSVLLCASQAWAQQSIVGGTRARITDRMVVGGSTFGEVMRIVGSPTVSSGTGTMNPAVIDADGDVLEDSFTTVSTAGAHTWGAAGQFSSTLGVTGATTLSSTLGVTGATTLSSTLGVTGAATLSSTLSVTGNISGSTGTLLATSPLQITTAAPFLRLIESGAGTDETVTELLADADTISLDLVADALGTRNSLFKSLRTGLVPGDWRWGSLLGNVRPENNGGTSLGSLTKKYLTLHAWELWVQTLVAQNTIATIGGRIFVAPTTKLKLDLASGDSCMSVEHNNLRTNDTVLLQKNGRFEKILIGSNAIDCSVSGNCAQTIAVYNYCSLTRNRDGTGANDWSAGDAVLNEGNVGDGYIDLYADRSATSEGYPGQVVSDGPVAYWRMNETTATTTADIMGNVGVATETGTQSAGLGVLSTLLGTATADPVWQNHDAGGYLLVANDTDLQITGDFTLEFWAFWEGGAAQNVISRGGTSEYHLQVNSGGSATFCHGNGSSSECETTAAGYFTNGGDYHHYAVVRDAQSSPKRILFYKDGALSGTPQTYTQTVTAQTLTTGIGENPGSLGAPFDGNIDEVAVYNYQVPVDRLLLHYEARLNNSISKFTVGPTLCGNVRTGTAAFDLSERWCLGNLAGTYNYNSVTPVYGFASGNASAAWMAVDATNGVRGMYGSTQKFGIDLSGVASFTEGAITIDDEGISIVNSTNAWANVKAYRFTGNIAYTDLHPGMFYLEGGGNGATVVTAGVRSSGTDTVAIAGDEVYLTATSGNGDIFLAATDNINFGALTITVDTNSTVTSNLSCSAGQAIKAINVYKGFVRSVSCGAP